MLLGTSVLGTGVLGSVDVQPPVLAISAVATLATASVAITVTGLDLSQYVTIIRNGSDGTQTIVRGANQHATFADSSITVGPTNVLSANDSSFESSVAGWDASTNCASTAQSATFAFLGTNSMKMTATAAGNMEAQLVDTLTVTPNQTYILSYWVYTGNAGRTATIEIDYFDATNTAISNDSLDLQGIVHTSLTKNSWTKIQLITTAPSNALFCVILVGPDAQLASEVFYIDDVALNTYTIIQGLNPGIFIITDFECPLNEYVTYTAQMGVSLYGTNTPVQSAFVTSTSVILNAPEGTVWLKNLMVPDLNTLVSTSSFSDVARTNRSQKNYIVGRKNPVVLKDTLGGRSGTITLQTNDLNTRTNFIGILESTSSAVLFIQACALDGFDDMYFCLDGDPVEQRPAIVSTDPTRLWTITYIEVDAPTDTATNAFSNDYLDVTQWFSYQDMFNQRSSYLSLLLVPFGSQPGDVG